MSTVTENQGILVVTRCWCGVQHAVPSNLRDLQVRQHDNGGAIPPIFCPLGHKHYPAGPSKAKEFEQRLQRECAAHDQTRAHLQDAENQRRAEKAAKTRLKTRIANGVCPCCHRTFANLRRHIKAKHPDYNKPGGAK